MEDGAAAAYKAVMKPTEGTILTVAREAANGALAAAMTSEDICDVLKGAVERGNKALERTPEQLPALKKAGVVDAGGQGWMFVLEGALYYLETGKQVEGAEPVSAPQTAEPPKKAQAAIDTKDIKFKYCTEFIVEKYEKGSEVDTFRDAIAPKGDCMLVIDDEEVVKVHIHTNHPGFVLEEAVKIGEMINLKIDNMKHQHKTLIKQEEPVKRTATVTAVPSDKPKRAKKPEEIKDFGFVAVASGKGFAAILKDLGVDKIIEGGQTMNPSTDDILKAVKRVKAKNVFIYPNNKNIIMAAEQAAELCEDKKLIVIPTRSLPECITAVMEFKPSKSGDDNKTAMEKAIKRVHTASVTYAVRDTEVDDIEIKKDDVLGLDGSSITMVGKNTDDVVERLADSIIDEDTEFITLYYGKDVRKASAEKLAAKLEEKYEDDEIEVAVKQGGQPVYYYVLSVE